MFKRILVAVDGSPTANQGLKTALALAADQRATIYVLHVLDSAAVAAGVAEMEYTPAGYIEQLSAGLRESGQKILNRAQAVALKQNLGITPLLVEMTGGRVAHAILKQARKLHADVIVLGTHGRRGLRRLLMGSDAEAVLREAKVPVLLVRAGTRGAATRAPRKASAKPNERTVGPAAPSLAVH